MIKQTHIHTHTHKHTLTNMACHFRVIWTPYPPLQTTETSETSQLAIAEVPCEAIDKVEKARPM